MFRPASSVVIPLASIIAVAGVTLSGSRPGAAQVPAHAASAHASASSSPLPASSANPLAPPTDCPAGMVALPGGTYPTGAAKHRVTIKPYCLDATEVVADAYAACVSGGKCTDAGVKCGDEATYGVAGSGQHPMNCVDWSQADTYCRAQAKRLPSEEEWEWAARGTTRGLTYPWGSDEPAVSTCWSGASKKSGTCVVGTFPASDSAEGVHDLAGNVWEWTASLFAAGDTARVGRGGGWRSEKLVHLSASNRGKNAPALRLITLGFRCAR